MNYSEMTDFEINCAVLAAIEPDVEHMELSADQKSFFHCGYDGNGFYETAIPDYCNSWADAGPIIEGRAITIAKSVMSGWHSYDFRCAKKFTDENPLRAAMIVFLMLESE